MAGARQRLAQLAAGVEEILVDGVSADQAATYLAGEAGHVSLLVRGPDLRAGMSSYLVDEVEAMDNIDVRLRAEVVELEGDTGLRRIETQAASREREQIDVDGLFVFIGADPCTDWLRGVLSTGEHGFLLTGAEVEVVHLDLTAPGGGRPALPLETSLPGVFAVGDGRSGSVKRVAAAVGEGSMAVRLVHEHLARLRQLAVVL